MEYFVSNIIFEVMFEGKNVCVMGSNLYIHVHINVYIKMLRTADTYQSIELQ